MCELIMQILEKSKAENVPVDVAYDMLAVDGDRDALKRAYKILDTHYVAITTLRRTGHNDEIATIVKMLENGEDVTEYIENLKKNGII